MYRRVGLAVVALGAVVSTAHADPAGPPVGGAGDGPGPLALAAVAVVVSAGALLVAGPRRPATGRRLGAMATAVLVAGALTIAAAHTVHHALDADQGTSCLVFQIAGSAEAASGATPPVVVAAVADAQAAPAAVAVAPLAAARGRAPPV